MKMYHLVEAESLWALSQRGAVNLPQVKELQDRLRAAGHDPGASDGWYGQKTANAVRVYQEANGLKVDGDAGSKTLAKLGMGGANTTPPTETPPAETPPAPAARQVATEPATQPAQTTRREPEQTTTRPEPEAEPTPTTRREPEDDSGITKENITQFLRDMRIDDVDYFDLASAPSVDQGKYPNVYIYLKAKPAAFEEKRLRDFFANFRDYNSPEALDYLRSNWPEKKRTDTKTGARNIIYSTMRPYLMQVYDQLENNFDFVNETDLNIFLVDDRGVQISGFMKEIYKESIRRISSLAGL